MLTPTLALRPRYTIAYEMLMLHTFAVICLQGAVKLAAASQQDDVDRAFDRLHAQLPETQPLTTGRRYLRPGQPPLHIPLN